MLTCEPAALCARTRYRPTLFFSPGLGLAPPTVTPVPGTVSPLRCARLRQIGHTVDLAGAGAGAGAVAAGANAVTLGASAQLAVVLSGASNLTCAAFITSDGSGGGGFCWTFLARRFVGARFGDAARVAVACANGAGGTVLP